MFSYDDEFEQIDFGEIINVCVKNIKINDYLVINGKPCKVINRSISFNKEKKQAQHKLTGIDIFEEQAYHDYFSQDQIVQTPQLKYLVYQVISIDDDKFLTLMDIKGNTRTDIKLTNTIRKDDKLYEKLMTSFKSGKEILITVLYSMGIEKIFSFKII
jgi:translation initiation factor 5A